MKILTLLKTLTIIIYSTNIMYWYLFKVLNSFQNNTGGLVSSVTRSTTSSALENLCYQKNRKEDMAYK